MDAKELKSAGLLERITSLTAKYENEIADLRVELTLLNEENVRLRELVQDGQAE